MAIEATSTSSYEPYIDEPVEQTAAEKEAEAAKSLVIDSPEFNDLLLDLTFGAEASDILEDD